MAVITFRSVAGVDPEVIGHWWDSSYLPTPSLMPAACKSSKCISKIALNFLSLELFTC